MARIFFALSCIAFLLLATNLVVGATTGDYVGAARAYQRAGGQYGDAAKQGGVGGEELARLREEMNEARTLFDPFSRHFMWHFWLGVTATLLTILVNSISVTYFIGTNRWCMEVIETYTLDRELASRSRDIKRTSFPWSVGSILAIIVVASLGALADPGRFNGSEAEAWVTIHWTCAVVATLFIGWSFLVQVGKIGQNYDVIETILLKVEEIRQRRKAAQTNAADETVVNDVVTE